jgi:sec-independent protein translocase protein TatC
MEESLEVHVKEFRRRFLYFLASFVASVFVSFYFSADVLAWLQADLGYTLNALHAYEAFYTQLMISMILGFFISLPVLVYQALKFVKPGLKGREYRAVRNYLPFSVILFVTGAAFSYQFVVKTSLAFFSQMNRQAEVAAIWGLRNTIGLALKVSGFTGIVFQLPIVSLVLSKAGLISSEQMTEYRGYFIVAVLVIAATATPPDMVTQALLTLPVILLYELSIYLVKRTE